MNFKKNLYPEKVKYYESKKIYMTKTSTHFVLVRKNFSKIDQTEIKENQPPRFSMKYKGKIRGDKQLYPLKVIQTNYFNN